MAVVLSYTPISTSPDTLPSQISASNSEQLNDGLQIYFYENLFYHKIKDFTKF